MLARLRQRVWKVLLAAPKEESKKVKDVSLEPFELPDFKSRNSLRKSLNYSRHSRSPMLLPRHTILTWKEPLDKKATSSSQCLSLLFGFEHDGRSHTIALKRPMNEEFVCTRLKIQSKLHQSISPGGKASRQPAFHSSHVNLSVEPDCEVLAKSFDDVISCSKSVSIGDVVYSLRHEPVDICVLAAALVPLVGCPMYPSIDYRAGNQPSSPPTLHWFVQPVEVDPEPSAKKKKNPIVQPPASITLENEATRSFSIANCEFRAKGPCYVPSHEDVGKRIVVLADMGPEAIVRCGISKHIVQSVDEPMLCEERLKWCEKEVEDGCLRLVSYNLLAALYLNLSLPQEQLFFPYCPKEYQQQEYRYPLLLREIKGYSADVYFLQEVDQRLRLRYLQPMFESMGMTMVFEKKQAEVNEGIVVAFRDEKFSLISSAQYGISELLDEESNADAKKILESSEDSMKIFKSRPTIVQIVVLRDVTSNELLVCGNTHLHHNPLHEHIKSIQGLVAARKIWECVHSHSSKVERVRVLFGGDFNSTPDGPVYQLFSTGKLSKFNVCWKLDPKIVVPADLQLLPDGSNLTNLTGCPPYTNYTEYLSDGAGVGFSGTLDYIWAQGWATRVQAPPVAHLDVVKHGALPSKISPSDHLPLIIEVNRV